MSHYDELGVRSDADRESIKRAYRKKAHQHHPDKGGSAEKFHAVQRAYDVLSNEARRAWYDRNGTDGPADQQDEALKNLAAIFLQVVDQADVEHQDVLAIVREHIERARSNVISQVDQHKAKVRKLETAKKRLTKKSSGPELLGQMLDGQIAANKRAMELAGENIKVFARMLELLKDYSYNADAQQYARNKFEWTPLGVGGF